MKAAKNYSCYLDGRNQPALHQSVAVFLDLLGVRREMAAAVTRPKQRTLVRKLHTAMNEAISHLDDEPDLPGIFAVKSFTDNVVLGWPILDDAEFELGSVFFRASAFQLSLIKHGFFSRGAIAVGPLHIGEHVVFGGALMEAYEAEQTLARDPRVVLAPSAEIYVRSHLRYYSRPKESPQSAAILKDTDGQMFVNYMNVIRDECGSAAFVSHLGIHRDAIESKLKEFRTEPKAWSKYLWCANYHNFVCKKYRPSTAAHRIVLRKFQSQPVSIV